MPQRPHPYRIPTDPDAFRKSVSGEVAALTLKGAPVGADVVIIEDSAGGFAKKKAPFSAFTGAPGRVVTTTAAANYPAAGNEVVYGDTTGANVTVDLPDAATVTGLSIWVKKIAAANTLNIDGFGAQTVEGVTVYSLTDPDQSVEIVSNGASWRIIG